MIHSLDGLHLLVGSACERARSLRGCAPPPMTAAAPVDGCRVGTACGCWPSRPTGWSGPPRRLQWKGGGAAAAAAGGMAPPPPPSPASAAGTDTRGHRRPPAPAPSRRPGGGGGEGGGRGVRGGGGGGRRSRRVRGAVAYHTTSRIPTTRPQRCPSSMASIASADTPGTSIACTSGSSCHPFIAVGGGGGGVHAPASS